tara:strand:+ start:346 stop:735 length:390 start_codon:yes stop_codon:yes gene_type:complete
MASELKVDKFTGVSTAGSILVTGEGNSTTTNLQQGLAKVWQQAQGDSTVTDSFNVASMTDSGTGTFTTNFTNAMNNAFYSGLSTGMSGDHLISNVSNTQSGQCRFDHYNQSNGSIDTGLHCVGILGDLA